MADPGFLAEGTNPGDGTLISIQLFQKKEKYPIKLRDHEFLGSGGGGRGAHLDLSLSFRKSYLEIVDANLCAF